MKILSWNVNGIRSVHKKNLLQWMRKEKADILCLQEIKADLQSIPPELKNVEGYHAYFNPASKKGYSGTAVYSKERPISVKSKIWMKRFDEEGRFLELEYRDFILISVYMPHGGRKKENLRYKLQAYDLLMSHLKKLGGKDIILIGDLNIAHKEIDLARPKNNKNNIMFTLDEREKIDRLINQGLIDTFRDFNDLGGQYTWWPYFADARKRNIGWRIDYAFVSRGISSRLKKASIFSKVPGSDHCPIGIELA